MKTRRELFLPRNLLQTIHQNTLTKENRLNKPFIQWEFCNAYHEDLVCEDLSIAVLGAGRAACGEMSLQGRVSGWCGGVDGCVWWRGWLCMAVRYFLKDILRPRWRLNCRGFSL